MPTTHPSPELLSAFLLGKLTGDEQLSVEEHVSGCDECCQKLSLVNDDTFGLLAREAVAQTRVLTADDSVPDRVPELDTVADIPVELRDHPRYRVLRVLGMGGMGTVFQAKHRVMDRMVALKAIAPRLTADKRALARFEQEVRAAAKLAHKHIVTAHDAETAGGLHFLVMEYVEGCSLSKYVLERGPMAVGQACMCAKQTADGLQHAHERGMIHRDIKPHNLMLTKKDGVKILDFGLARFVQDEAADHTLPEGRKRPGLTMAGSVLGSPDFIAPEQVIDARSADIRADIYSLGCTLYYLLSGRAPFTGDLYEKLQSHRDHTPPSLVTLREDLPRDLVEVIEKMMAKDPAERYQTPKDVSDALKPFCRREFSGAAPAVESLPDALPTEEWRPRARRSGRRSTGFAWRKHLPLVIAAAVALPVLLAAAAYFRPSGTSEQNSTLVSAGDASKETALVSEDKPGTSSPLRVAPSPQRKKVLLIVPQVFWANDFYPVHERLKSHPLDVTIASSAWTAESRNRSEEVRLLNADKLVKHVPTSGFDAVLFMGTAKLNEFEQPEYADRLQEIIRNVQERNGVVGSICRGTRVLAGLGVLDGYRARAHEYLRLYQEEPDVMRPSVTWVETGPDVVVDGPFITARDAPEPRIARAFADKVAAALLK